jgi:glycosyltransferase involved in cell wall biosynthesis
MPTVCLDCRYLGPRPSGIGGVVRALVDYLPALAPDWHFKLLRNASLDHPLSDERNVTEVKVRAEANGPATMWLLPQIVDLRDVDLFHAPSNILPRGLTMPCVTTIHDVMWLTNPELCNPNAWGFVERFFYRHGINRALRKSDAILTVSEATRSDILDLRPELSKTTFAFLSGVSNSFRPRTVSQVELSGLGLPSNPYILAVGQFAPYKNHEGAIRGFAMAFAKDPAIDLVILQRRGAGSDILQQLVNGMGLAGRVHFLPPLEEQDLAAIYSGALALLHPSFKEGFGMPLAEAMACGCPVVTSDLSSMPEVTAGAALLVDPRDPASIAAALRRVVQEPGLARKLRRLSLERARQLDWRIFVDGNLEVYRNVLENA